MLEFIICSVIGAVCICGGSIFAWYKYVVRSTNDDEAYVLDMRDSELNFTFNEIYKDPNNTLSKV